MTSVLAALAASALLGGCGGGGAHSDTATGPRAHRKPAPLVVHLYSSLPLGGPGAGDAQAIREGIAVALAQAHHRAGSFRVRYTALDDSPPDGGGWSAARVLANARRAALDPEAMLLIGNLDSGATQLSAPILNLAGISQLTPGSTYVGLTDAVAGVTPRGEPQRFFPSHTRTLLRLVSSDAVQTAAQLLALKQGGCTRLAVVHQRGSYFAGLAAMLTSQSHGYGLTAAYDHRLADTAPGRRAQALQVRLQDPGCVAIAASPSRAVTQLSVLLHLQLPHAPLMGPATLCTPAWTSAAHGGVPAAVAPELRCTLPVLGIRAYTGAGAFTAAYRRLYGVSPRNPYALYGYEAAELGIDAVSSLGRDGDARAMISRFLFAVRDRPAPIGTFGFTANGDTTLARYGLYVVGASGRPVYDGALRPTRYLTLPSGR